MSAVTEVLTFPGPADRTIPKSPLVSYQLRHSKPVSKIDEVVGADLPPCAVAEAWSGCAILTTEMIRLGFTRRAYECSPNGEKTPLPEGDIERA